MEENDKEEEGEEEEHMNDEHSRPAPPREDVGENEASACGPRRHT